MDQSPPVLLAVHASNKIDMGYAPDGPRAAALARAPNDATVALPRIPDRDGQDPRRSHA